MRKFEVAEGFEGKVINMPERKTMMSAGYDIYAIEDTIIPVGKMVVVNTGLKVWMHNDEFLDLRIRSGLAFKNGLMMVNSCGVIDSDYYGNEDNDGHIMAGIRNFGEKDVHIKAGDRVCQAIFIPYFITSDDKASGFRDGGIGSTGIR